MLDGWKASSKCSKVSHCIHTDISDFEFYVLLAVLCDSSHGAIFVGSRRFGKSTTT